MTRTCVLETVDGSGGHVGFVVVVVGVGSLARKREIPKKFRR